MFFFIVPRFRHATVFYACPASAWVPFLLSVGSASHSVFCYAFTSGFCSLCGTPIRESKGHSFRIGAASAAGLPDWLIKVLGRWSSDCINCIFALPKQSCFLLFPKSLVCQGTLFSFLLLLGGMHCMHLWRLSLSCDFPQAFSIACVLPSFELFLCLNLVRSSPCGAGEIRKALPRFLSYPTVVGG